MAGYFIQQDWTEKPPSGTPLRRDGHWNVQGLVGCWAFNEGGGSILFDAVSRCNADAVDMAWTSGGVKFGSGGYAIASVPTIPLPATIISSFRHSGAASSIFSHDAGTSAVAGYRVSIDPATSRLRFTLAGVADYVFSGLPIAVIGSNYTIAVSATGNGGVATGYMGGGSQVLSIGSVSGAASKVQINRDRVDTTNNTNEFYLQLFFSRALSAAEIASLSANPWQVFQPRTIWVEVGAAAITFNPAWAAGCNQIIGGGCV